MFSWNRDLSRCGVFKEKMSLGIICGKSLIFDNRGLLGKEKNRKNNYSVAIVFLKLGLISKRLEEAIL